MVKRAQTATEFIAVFGFFLFAATFITVIFSQNIYQSMNVEQQRKISIIAQYVAQEIHDAQEVGIGYERILKDPMPTTNYVVVIADSGTSEVTPRVIVYEGRDVPATAMERANRRFSEITLMMKDDDSSTTKNTIEVYTNDCTNEVSGCLNEGNYELCAFRLEGARIKVVESNGKPLVKLCVGN